MATPSAPEQPRSTSRDRRPRREQGAPPVLAEGLELMGEYEGSGFKEAPYIARRMDGQTIQLTRLLHLVAEAADGHRDAEAMADWVTERLGRRVSADNIRFLVEKKLRPLGVLAAADGTSPNLERPDPLLALKFRTALISERTSKTLTTIFKPLFFPPVVIAILLTFAAAVGWLFFVHGVGQSLRGLIYNPAYLLVLFAGIVLGTAFHEIGHASALHYGGGRPGVMGAGIYVVWPAFYTDVTDAYRLGKTARLRTDLGGIYFNMIVAIVAVAVNVITGWEVILLLAVAQTFAITQQLLPFLRLDGYYILSDLTGVPDMLTRIRPVLKSIVPGKEADAKVTALKPWARRVVTTYILLLIPILALGFIAMLAHAPRAFATAYDSFFVQTDRIGTALDDGSIPAIIGGGFQMLFLALPLAGMVLTTSRVGRRGVGGAWRGTEERPVARGALVAGTLASVALAAFIWWPNGDYRPIQPTEKGTLVSAVSNLAAVPSGRPSLTAARQEQLGGAPTERDVRSGKAERSAVLSGDEPTDTVSPAETRRSERRAKAAQKRRAAERRRARRENEQPATGTTGGSAPTTSTATPPPATPPSGTTGTAPATTSTAPATTAPPTTTTTTPPAPTGTTP